MSEENVEIVRRSFAAYNRGGIEKALELWAPDATAGAQTIGHHSVYEILNVDAAKL
jgi:ketosteroid isomerase-like protein